MERVDVVRAIWENPARARTPIILISAFPYMRAMYLDGCNGFIQMPIKALELPTKTAKAHQTIGVRDLRAVEVGSPGLLYCHRSRSSPYQSPRTHAAYGKLCSCGRHCSSRRSPFHSAGRGGRYSQARGQKLGLTRLQQNGPKRFCSYNTQA
jgi:hypothetical protein